MKEVFIVAEKELRDFVSGKLFIFLLAVTLFLALVGIVSGMQSYNTQMDQYKATQAQSQEQIQQMQDQIDKAVADGMSQEQISAMKSSLEMMKTSQSYNMMPSILQFFYQFNMAFNTVGIFLAIVMGFSLISGERESGTLKLLLTRPTYRDSVINGKALAGITALAIILVVAFLMTMAALMIYGVMPSGDDLYRVIAYFAVTMLFMTTIFAISLLASTICRTSMVAILCMIGVYVFITVMPGAVYSLMGVAMGQPPQSPTYPSEGMVFTPPRITDLNSSANIPMPTESPAMKEYNNELWKYYNDSISYYNTQKQITDITTLLSPSSEYSFLTSGIVSKQKPMTQADYFRQMSNNSNNYGPGPFMSQEEISVADSLSYVWLDLLGMLVIIVAAFGGSYLAFLRSDVT